IRDKLVTGVQTCALPILRRRTATDTRGRRHLPPGRTADDVARAYPSLFVAVTQRSGALHDEEHLFLAAMAVKGTRAFARWYDIRSEERRVGKEERGRMVR